MKTIFYLCILLCVCTSCASTYQIPEEYDLVEDCSEIDSCGEIDQ